MKFRPFPLLLAAILLASCGESSAPVETTAADSTDTTTAAETGLVYEFTEDYGGYEFRILNSEDIYNMHATIIREEQTGETLNDAMFKRCSTLEEKLNITLTEDHTAWAGDGVAAKARTSIMAGDDSYDIAFISQPQMVEFAAEGYVYDLMTMDEMNLDQPWWSKTFNDANTRSGSLYFAAGYAQLQFIDSLWMLFFNEDMMTNLKLDMPYDLVRDGKWTLDAYHPYLKAAAQLNGDDSFNWETDKNCIYGQSGNAIDKYLAGSNEHIIEVVDGKVTLTAGSSHYYDVIDKLLTILTPGDGCYYGNPDNVSDGQPGNYITMFEDQRALFVCAELSKTNRMRDKSFSYGIVPFPKYDENQKSYYATPYNNTPAMSIPVTVSDVSRTATIADALTYLSWDIVLPVFREVTLEQKNLRNDDSVEMLGIIIDSVVPSLLSTVSPALSMLTEVARAFDTGTNIAASQLASGKAAIDAMLAEINA